MRCYAYHRGARDRRFYLVMELLQGPNLEQVRSQTPLRLDPNTRFHRSTE